MLTALASDAPPVTRTELEESPMLPELEVAPSVAAAAPARGAYAISWREREVHRADVNAHRKDFDGRSLVMGLCGGLGWGPVHNPPAGWPICDECDEITTTGFSSYGG
ncbi:hypothetical protein [Saccharopolyspora sp. 5N708]|uniref:hypothetical protein n=1 Tax=Saccharopolyspora sp. 5N708 TaxID=3457424 RepID=UPI003FD56B41